MTWTQNRVRVAGGKKIRAEVLDAYPYCCCGGCVQCGGWDALCAKGKGLGDEGKAMRLSMLGCARPSTEDDHIIPVAEGGTEEWDNHQGLCTECHKVKSLKEAVRGRARKRARLSNDEPHPGLLTLGGDPPAP